MTEEIKTDELDKPEEKTFNGNSREEMVNLINERREEQINSEILESGGSIEPMHTEEETVAIETEIKDVQAKPEDPLANFIQTGEDGVQMFKMQVDGAEVLVPLADVQKAHQLESASRKRMEENADWSKNLARREEEIRLQEAALKSSLVEDPPSPDVDDRDFVSEAQEIFGTLIDEDAEVASGKLAKVLSDINRRTSSQTPLDTQKLVEDTTAAVTERLSAKEEATKQAATEQNFKDGLTQFQEQYPEINSDPLLYGAANSMTNVIAVEHPEWTPTEIMLEAGKRTQEWADKKGQPVLIEDSNTNDRQTRKDNLVPMPASRSGRQEAPITEEAQTPSAMLAEVRAARGQPG